MLEDLPDLIVKYTSKDVDENKDAYTPLELEELLGCIHSKVKEAGIEFVYGSGKRRNLSVFTRKQLPSLY